MHVCACSFYTTTYKPFTEKIQFRVTLIIFSIDFVLLERKKGRYSIFLAPREGVDMGSMNYFIYSGNWQGIGVL